MPANKNQIRRIQTILKMMRQNRYPNFTSFIKEMKNQDKDKKEKIWTSDHRPIIFEVSLTN